MVAPKCKRDATDLRLVRLHGSSAVVELLRYPRTIGWTGAEHSRGDLSTLADLASSVAIYQAELPWAASVDPALGQTLLKRLGFKANAAAPGIRQGSTAC